jgi:hypothetical protein
MPITRKANGASRCLPLSRSGFVVIVVVTFVAVARDTPSSHTAVAKAGSFSSAPKVPRAAGRAAREGIAASPGEQTSPPIAIGGCTMAVPARRATIEVQIADGRDFCELMSHALADDVFHASVVVTPRLLWHYADGTLSCHLRYRATPSRLTIRNSPPACHWMRRVASGWHVEPEASLT